MSPHVHPERHVPMSSDHDRYSADFVVGGMTCEHCVASVTEEVSEIDGVREVRVDLATGSVSVISDQPVDAAAVAAAVEEAGYQLT